jgi:hypothetical protein
LAFDPLASRMQQSTFPLLLCGPVLRRVTSSAVTVWLVTRESATVTLTVYSGKNGAAQVLPPLTAPVAQASTTAIGTNFHVVAITARGPDKTLSEGNLYTYNLAFKFANSGSKAFNEAAGVTAALAEFAYDGFTLPSFVLPPTDLEKLRIMHGSCRKPNGGGADALALLDDLIAVSADPADGRPHQLFMTGDQIYADEVADILLLMLIDAAETLLGWSEVMPAVPTAPNTPLLAKALAPGTRTSVIKAAGFTSDDTRSHLVALGEYLTMYLFAWSPVLWPATLPVKADLPVPAVGSAVLDDFKTAGDMSDFKWAEQQLTVQTYFNTLTKVRRALANIPSYMICDDHEITDDWNMTREFCEKVYGTDFGLRVVQNGLTAYAICQAWGNTPEQFEDVTGSTGVKPAGRQLLTKLDGGNATSLATNGSAIQTIVGLHTAAALATSTPYGPYHEGGAQFIVNGANVDGTTLNYYYTVEGPAYQVIVTDTRTWRQFPVAGKVEHSDLLAGFSLTNQVSNIPALGNRLQVVVVTTNMPPIPPIRVAERTLPSIFPGQIYTMDLFDSWSFPSAAFDMMVLRLSDRLPLDTGTPQARSGPVVVLSGDVHTSYASRLTYWATKRFGDDPNSGHPATVVFAELVASPFKNEGEKTRGQHMMGYDYIPKDLGMIKTAAAKVMLPDKKPEGVYGWAVPSGIATPVKVGWTVISQGGTNMQVDLTVSGIKPSASFNVLYQKGTLASILSTIDPDSKADYQYRADQIYAAASGQAPAPPPTLPGVGAAMDAATRKLALTAFNTASSAYRNYKNTSGKGRAIVGRSNICELTFTGTAGNATQVHQTVRWYETTTPGGEVVDTSKVFWARYDVSLTMDPQTYPQLPYPPP